MSNKITYHELIDQITDRTGKTKQQSHDFMTALTKIIEDGLEQDGRVRISNLGIFDLHEIPATTGVSPQTGATIPIPAHTRTGFRPASSLEELVNREFTHLKARRISEPQPEPTAPEPVAAPREITETRVPVMPPAPPNRRPWVIGGIAVIVAFLIYQLFLTGDGSAEPLSIQEFASESADPFEPAVEPDPFAVPDQPVVPDEAQEFFETAQLAPEETPEQIPAEESPTPVEPEVTPDDTAEESEPASMAGVKADVHRIRPGDNLWLLSERYYGNPVYWPNIYRVNLTRVRNPHVLMSGVELIIPRFAGEDGALTALDSLQISAGYFEAYQTFKDRGIGLADYCLEKSREFQ